MTMSEVAGVTISEQVKVIMSERDGSDYEWGGGLRVTVTAGLSEQLTLSLYSIFICVVFVIFREVM